MLSLIAEGLRLLPEYLEVMVLCQELWINAIENLSASILLTQSHGGSQELLLLRDDTWKRPSELGSATAKRLLVDAASRSRRSAAKNNSAAWRYSPASQLAYASSSSCLNCAEVMRDNVEADRTTTIAAEPPPAVVGPCRATSYAPATPSTSKYVRGMPAAAL
jgi:hypothetical protein